LGRDIGKFNRHQRAALLPPLLVGVGLLILGLAAFIILPKPGSTTGNKDEIFAVPIAVEFSAPSLSLIDLQGNQVGLEDYRGQVILVNNWATWCPPCKAEMPTFEAFYQEHKEKGFTIVAIEAGQSQAEVVNFVNSYKLSFPVWLDAHNKALDAFRNQRLPNSYLIDRDGTVRLAWTGAISRQMLDKYVTLFLED
jgi:cytochrome c biogenesis protein CcmG, thiol:disulfide interchange protein DsbE